MHKGLSLTEFYSGATRLSGRFNEGLLLRRSQKPLTGPPGGLLGAISHSISGNAGGRSVQMPKFGKVRLHDLRHTAASHAVMSGENLPLVGCLLGHRRHRTAAGYTYLADGHLVEAAQRVSSIIVEAMTGDA